VSDFKVNVSKYLQSKIKRNKKHKKACKTQTKQKEIRALHTIQALQKPWFVCLLILWNMIFKLQLQSKLQTIFRKQKLESVTAKDRGIQDSERWKGRVWLRRPSKHLYRGVLLAPSSWKETEVLVTGWQKVWQTMGKE